MSKSDHLCETPSVDRYVTMAPGMDDLVVMRLLRVFRPLRIINKLEGMKAIVKTLANSAAGLRDTFVLCIFIFFLFGIVGDTLFSGVLKHRCFLPVTVNDTTTYEEDADLERMCGGAWECPSTHKCMFSNTNPNYDITSFDHIAAGFLTIFVAITLEGWVDVMYMVQDGYSYVAATIYFHLLVIVGSLFAVNLALAVISDCFDQTLVNDDELSEEAVENMIEKDLQEGYLGGGTEEGLSRSTISVHRHVKRLSNSVMPAPATKTRVLDGCRSTLAVIADAPAFNNFMLLSIIGNTFALSIEHSKTITVEVTASDGTVYMQNRAGKMDATLDMTLEVFNAIFVGIFTVELFVKATGVGLREYWKDSFNRFDFLVVVMSYVEIIGTSSGSFTALRAFRLMRIFKVARKWKAMQTIMRCILETLPSMGYLCILLLLFMFIMAVAGMFLFGAKMGPPKMEEVPRGNFDNFGWAMLSVFQILSGENWNEILYDGINVAGPATCLYFLILVCIGTFIVLNLTLAILLSNFDEGDYGEDDMFTLADVRDLFLSFIPCAPKYTAAVAPENDGEDAPLPQTPVEKYTPAEETPTDEGTVLSSAEEGSPGKGSGSGLEQSSPTIEEAKKLGVDTGGLQRTGTNGTSSPKMLALAEAEMNDDGDLAKVLDHVKGKMCSSMLGGIEEVKQKADVAFYFHQMKINFQYHDPELEAAVFHTSMTEAIKQHNDTARETKELEDSQKDCTGCIPGEAPELTQRSLYLFQPDSRIRVALAHVVVHPVFENLILFLIITSSVTLAMDQPDLKKGSELYNVLQLLDIFFTIIFTIELILKVIVYGLISSGEDAYLKDPWNMLDAFIVTISITSVFAGDAVESLRSLRTLRALRPLRTIKRAPGLRCVVEAIIRCIPPFVNIAMVSTVFYLIFAILGTQFWAGKFWSCNDDSVSGADECVGTFELDGVNTTRVWSNAPIHFDNVSQGMLTLFEVASLELWLDVMYSAMDVPDELGLQPVKNSSPWYALYFVIFVVIGAFLILNLFVGAVVDTFTLVKNEQNRVATMTPAQAEFVSSMRLMMQKQPGAAMLPPEEDGGLYWLRSRCYKIIMYDLEGNNTGALFDTVVIFLIIMNVIVMSLVIWKQPPADTEVGTIAEVRAQETDWNTGLSTVNLVFTLFFVAEAALKLIGLGVAQYFSSNMNVFDFVVVAVSVIGDVLDRTVSGYDMTFANMLLIFRAARVMRIFRLFTRFKGVRRLLETLIYTMPSLLNVTTLLVMVLFIYTILGMSFFGTMPLCPDGPCPYGLYNDHANFRYFHIGFFTLFRMSTGESWNGIMHDCTAIYGGRASFYFVSYMVIGSSLMFNLVIAILLDEFSSMGASDNYEVSPDAIANFVENWQRLDPEGSHEIPCKKLVSLLRVVEPPLGVGPDGSASEAHLMLLKVNAPLNAGYAHFVETFVALVRFAYKVCEPTTSALSSTVL